MGKRISKAEMILTEAEKRIAMAEVMVDAAEKQLQDARSYMDRMQAILSVHQSTYDALKISLAPTPRKASVPKSQPVPSAGKRSPRSKSVDESKVNSETEKGDALLAAGASGD